MKLSKKIHVNILISIFFATVIPGLSFAQQDSLNASQDSFPKTIHYLSTAYLKGMQDMTNQTTNDLTRMEKVLSVSIAMMLKENQQTIQGSTSQLNRDIITQLLPEMKELSKKVMLMNHQLSMEFNPKSGY